MAWLWEQNHRIDSFLLNELRDRPYTPATKQPKPKLPNTPNTKPVKTQKKPVNKRDANVEKIELFACKICQKRYTSKAGYSRHYNTAHESGKEVKKIKNKSDNVASRALCAWPSSARFSCNHCGKELSSKASLDRHQATHDRAPKPKARQTKVTATTTKIKVINNVNCNGHHSTPNDLFSVASSSFWN